MHEGRCGGTHDAFVPSIVLQARVIRHVPICITLRSFFPLFPPFPPPADSFDSFFPEGKSEESATPCKAGVPFPGNFFPHLQNFHLKASGSCLRFSEKINSKIVIFDQVCLRLSPGFQSGSQSQESRKDLDDGNCYNVDEKSVVVFFGLKFWFFSKLNAPCFLFSRHTYTQFSNNRSRKANQRLWLGRSHGREFFDLAYQRILVGRKTKKPGDRPTSHPA